jgi:periplasmic protein CpxP/Spy
MQRNRLLALRAAPALAAVAASALILLAPVAQAQGPGHHHGSGFFPKAIAAVKAKLNLTSAQQLAWDNAVAHARTVHQNARESRGQVHEAMRAELAKPEPNLAAVAALADDVEQQNRSARKQVRDEWLAFYNALSPTQKAIVRDVLTERMARADSFRDRMHRHLHERGRGANG